MLAIFSLRMGLSPGGLKILNCDPSRWEQCDAPSNGRIRKQGIVENTMSPAFGSARKISTGHIA